MHRPLVLAALLGTLAACKVEPTPREFYTQRAPGVVERQEGVDEMRARVSNFAAGLARGDRAGAVQALSPIPLAEVVGIDANRGVQRFGAAGLAQALMEIDVPAPAVARLPDLRVGVSEQGQVGWFSSHLELLPTTLPIQDAVQLRVTGVFQRNRGEWRLSQVHVSRPRPPASAAPRPGAAATDSPSAPPPPPSPPPSGEAPGGGG